MAKGQMKTAQILRKYEDDLIAEWIREMKASGSGKDARIGESELHAQAKDFVRNLLTLMEAGDTSDMGRPEWKSMTAFLEGITRSRVLQGFSSDETAAFVFSFKKPFFSRLRTELGRDAEALGDETWLATQVLD